MKRFCFSAIVASSLFAPSTLKAQPVAFYALEGTGAFSDIYAVGPDGSSTVFTTGQGGFCMTGDAAGNLYVNNTGWTLSKITPSGSESTYAFAEGDNGAFIHGPFGLAFDPSGNLYSSNPADGTIAKTSTSGVVSTFVSGLNYPGSLASDAQGNLYAASINGNLIYKITPTGTVSTFATMLTGELAFDATGDLFVADLRTISEITPAGKSSTFYSGGTVFVDIAFDSSGKLYAADDLGHIVNVTPAGLTPFATLPDGIAAFVAEPVPEPSSLAIIAAAAVATVHRRRRPGV